MRLIRQLRRYLFWRWPLQRVPLQLITEYSFTDSNEDQRLIMMFGAARSPGEAQRLMDKYDAPSAAALFEVLPPPKRQTWRDRARTLIRNMDGHYRGNPYKRPHADQRVDIRAYYSYRRKR